MCANIQLKFLNEDHPDMANTYITFSQIFRMEPDFDAVILYLKKALYINKAKFGEFTHRLHIFTMNLRMNTIN